MSGSGLKPATRTIEQAQSDIDVVRAGAILASKSMASTAYIHNKDKLIVGWVIDRTLFENASAPLSGLKEIARGYLAASRDGWNYDTESLPRDATILVSVRRRNGEPFIRNEMAATFPAYIDESGRICDAGTWAPDKGLHGDHFETFAWRHLPSPALSQAKGSV